jgi:hypothetical protein
VVEHGEFTSIDDNFKGVPLLDKPGIQTNDHDLRLAHKYDLTLETIM